MCVLHVQNLASTEVVHGDCKVHHVPNVTSAAALMFFTNCFAMGKINNLFFISNVMCENCAGVAWGYQFRVVHNFWGGKLLAEVENMAALESFTLGGWVGACSPQEILVF